MKKYVIRLWALLIMAGAFTTSTPYARGENAERDGGRENDAAHKETEDVERLRFSLGVNLWYCWWRPVFSQVRIDRYLNLGRINPTIDPTLQFGPALSLEINRSWAIEALFTYADYPVLVNKVWPLEIPLRPKRESRARRYEAEVTAARRIYKNMVSFHAGLKYLGHDSRVIYLRRYLLKPNHGGIIAGFDLAVPLVQRLSFLVSLSGIVMAGRERTGVSAAAGGIFTGSFAYAVAGTGMTIAIGGRVQYLDYFGSRDPYAARDDDRHYGMAVSLKYSFE